MMQICPQRRRTGAWIAIAVAICVAIGSGHHARAATPAAPSAASAVTPDRFSVEVMGEGPDVILIPGLASPREVWRPTAEALKAHYRLHLVQLRGFGEAAGANASGPVLAPTVAALARYIADNQLRRPAVVGHSLGGLAAMMLAADHPEAVGRLMVVDAVPFIGTLFDPSATVEAMAPRAEAMRAMLMAQAAARKGQPPAPASDCGALTGEAPPVPGAMARSARAACMVAGWSAAADPQVMTQAMVDDMTTDMRPRLSAITAPLTVVIGQDERVLPPETSLRIYREAYAQARSVTLVPVARSAHFVMLDQPEAMLAALQGFLGS